MYELTINFTDRDSKVLKITCFEAVILVLEIAYKVFNTVKGFTATAL